MEANTILVINSGSSTVKYRLFHHIEGERFEELCSGIVDRIGIDGSKIVHRHGSKELEIDRDIESHEQGVKEMLTLLVDETHGVLKSTDQIDAIGHRIVHGGEHFLQSTRLNKEAVDTVRSCIPLAPLHNPHNLDGITACGKLGKPQVGVFDTAFHSTMPEARYRYAIPKEFFAKYRMRRFGFHGISHQFVAKEAAKLLGKPLGQLKLVTCHLGNGSSLTAILHGKSIENTMGYTPLEGVVMGTRCGSIDPAIPTIIGDRERMKPAEVEEIMNKESGLLALAGTRDMRDILENASKGNKDAELALEIFTGSVVKGIGSYIALLDGADAIVFTAGIGENAVEVRKRILAQFTYMGLKFDSEANVAGKKIITAPESKMAALVIPTNEELEIARETRRVLGE